MNHSYLAHEIIEDSEFFNPFFNAIFQSVSNDPAFATIYENPQALMHAVILPHKEEFIAEFKEHFGHKGTAAIALSSEDINTQMAYLVSIMLCPDSIWGIGEDYPMHRFEKFIAERVSNLLERRIRIFPIIEPIFEFQKIEDFGEESDPVYNILGYRNQKFSFYVSTNKEFHV